MGMQRVSGAEYTVEVSESFEIPCTHCRGSGWQLSQRYQPAPPEGAKWTNPGVWILNGEEVGIEGYPVVETCSRCEGSRSIQVVERLSGHTHEWRRTEGPCVDNNFQGVYRCDDCHTVILG